MKHILSVIVLLLLFSCNNTDDQLVDIPEPEVATEFMPTLSEMNLFSGDLSELNLSSRAFEYKINTPLFSDYSYKHRIIALPDGTSMSYVNDLLPNFPDDTVIAKTFYYHLDERDETLGRQIIETRLLIKKDDVWLSGNYIWNQDQTDAFLDISGSTLPVSFINLDGNTVNVSYEVPTNEDCITCHQNNGSQYPIGPKLRSMNFTLNGVNQLEDLISKGHLINVPDINTITSLPNWEEQSNTLQERARAYFDINCAHCHESGGYFETLNGFNFVNLSYEIPFDESNIYQARNNILSRMQEDIEDYSMPFIGTTMIHAEGLELIEEFIESL